MTTKALITAAIVGSGMIAAAGLASAQGVDIGKREYDNNCAVCHGVNGKGDGPLAGFLNQRVADLTMLQKDNNGVFPFAQVYDVIDGQQIYKAHGTRDMPVWGDEYMKKAPEWVGPEGTRAEYASFVRARILALIGYISTFQAK